MLDVVSAPEVPEVVQRLVEEGPISITAAAKLVGSYREGKPTHSSTLTRWALKGCKLPDGRILKLEAYRVAGRLMTSKPALLRFIAAQNEEPTDSPIPPPTPNQRQRAAATASREAAAIFGAD